MANNRDPMPTSLSALLAAPKGRTEYVPGDAFLLHVFWEAPSASAAHTLLSGLQKCATATLRDAPCAPTYVFRVSNNDASLCPPPPRTVGDHPHVSGALKKLDVGIPVAAVRAELTKRGIDPSLAHLDASSPLPNELQTQPVAVEFTEVYLDERAFMDHAGSREYLDGYAVVMHPALHYRIPRTVRLGTPPEGMVERILEPVLHEIVMPLHAGCAVWRQPQSPPLNPVLLSLDVPWMEAFVEGSDGVKAGAAVTDALSIEFREQCTTCVAFTHPLRSKTTRLLCVIPSLPQPPILACLASLCAARGEAHITASSGDPSEAEAVVRDALAAAGLGFVTVNASECVGHVLHPRAADLHPLHCDQ